MQSLIDLLHHVTDAHYLITWGGYVGLTVIIFAETGLLVGFFFPGDSLLVTAGLFAAVSGQFDVYVLGLLLSIASVAGNSVGYAIGRVTGPRLFTRDDSTFFKKRHLQRAHAFY